MPDELCQWVLIWSEHIFYLTLEDVWDILDLRNTEVGDDSRVWTGVGKEEADIEDIEQEEVVAADGDDTAVGIDAAVVDIDVDMVVDGAVDIVGSPAVGKEVSVAVYASW